MAQLWLLKGDHEAAGWKQLRKAFDDEKVDVVHLDPSFWALIRAEQPPEGFEGLHASAPLDGVYVDPNGTALFIVGCQVATEGPTEVIKALGDTAEALLEKLGDPLLVLERLDRAF